MTSQEAIENKIEKSIFVVNIPNDATEEDVMELFSEFGPVIDSKFYKDNVCQYGLCEYNDREIALRAVRGLNNYDLKGSDLKVDIASSEQSKERIANLAKTSSLLEASGSGTPGDNGTIEKAPEEISKAVASLPADQMFELMKQMKMCIENNPQEARNLLLQNPQLAFALLQAQVIMRIVDPDVALKILNRPLPAESEDGPKDDNPSTEQTAMETETEQQAASSGDQDLRRLSQPSTSLSADMADKDMRQTTSDVDLRSLTAGDRPPSFDPRFRPADPRMMPGLDPRLLGAAGVSDPRQMPADPRAIVDPRAAARGGMDPRGLPVPDPRTMFGGVLDPRLMGADPRMMPGMMIPGSDPRTLRGMDPRMAPTGIDPRMIPGPLFPIPSAMIKVEDPRKNAGARGVPAGVQPMQAGVGGGPSTLPEDEEKAALIMQVLQLSDDQISRLPPEQRNSILVLKEQIARSQI